MNLKVSLSVQMTVMLKMGDGTTVQSMSQPLAFSASHGTATLLKTMTDLR